MISLKTFSMTHKLLRSVLFGCQMFGNFPVSFCYLFILLFHYGWRTYSLYFSSFTLDAAFFLGPKIWTYLVYIPWTLEKKYILLWLGGVLYR